MTILDDRLAALDALTLDSGGHDNLDDGAGLMEAVAWITGEPWSDHPACASPILGAFGRALNDAWNDENRQRLKPFIPRLVGTAGDGLDQARGLLAADWIIRTYTPAWLRLAGLETEAVALETLPRQATWDETMHAPTHVEAAVPTLRIAKEKASAAWVAAWAAAGAAAWDAAGAAARDAAGAAAGDAAWAAAMGAAWGAAGDAAWAAAMGAAWGAAGAAAWGAAGAAARAAACGAARDAAWAAAMGAAWGAARDAAGAALQPTVEFLRDSALDLFDRMIDPAAATAMTTTPTLADLADKAREFQRDTALGALVTARELAAMVLAYVAWDREQTEAVMANPAATQRLLAAVRDHREPDDDEEPRTPEPWRGYR